MRPFPVDEINLSMLEEALNTRIAFDENDEPYLIGGEFSVANFLEFLSGPSNFTEEGNLTVRHEPMYSEHDVIRALIAEIRRLRNGTAQHDPR